MFSENDFQLWCQSLSLPEQTRALINQIRNSDPSRRVRSMAGNVSGFYPSRKMKRTIQFESHRNELAAILEMEHDPDVCELCGQFRYVAQGYIPSLKSPPQRIPTPHNEEDCIRRARMASWQ